MTLLVVAEVKELRTESPLLMIQKTMVKKTRWLSVGARGIVSVVLFVKDHKQAVNRINKKSETKPRILKAKTKSLKVVLESFCFPFLKNIKKIVIFESVEMF